MRYSNLNTASAFETLHVLISYTVVYEKGKDISVLRSVFLQFCVVCVVNLALFGLLLCKPVENGAL